MFNNNDRVIQISQSPERLKKPFVIPLVEPDARFVKDVQNSVRPEPICVASRIL